MEPKDLSAYIAAISKNYLYPETPKEVSTFEDLTLRFLRNLVDFLNSLNIRIPYPSHENVMTVYMMLAVFVVAFIAITVMVVILVKSVNQNTHRLQSRVPVDANLEPLLDSASWMSIADELASESNFRSACRAVFLSSLLALDELSIAEFVPALSNYEYLYKLSRHKVLQSKVRELANKVDLVWFGNHDAISDDYLSSMNLHSEIKTLAEDVLQRRQLHAQ